MNSPLVRSVLLVEDEPGFRLALRTHFSRCGWNTAVASGAREAATALQLGSFDLVVSDMRMVDGSGFDVLAAAQQLALPCAVLFLTGSASIPEAVEAVRGGAVDYLVKPVPFGELLARAEQHVAARRRLRPVPVVTASPPTETCVATEPCTRAPLALCTMSEMERSHLESTLQRVGGNRTQAAQLLGISVRTLRNKVRQYDLPPRRYA